MFLITLTNHPNMSLNSALTKEMSVIDDPNIPLNDI